MAVRIIGTGSYAPDRILTNADLEKMVETSDEWITSRTGIRQRHIADRGTPTSELAYHAACHALESAGITAQDLGFISVASVTNDQPFPSTACFLQKKLRAAPCPCYDLQAACAGLLYSLEIAVSMLRSHQHYRYCLVVGAEKLSSVVDWSDRSTCVLFGDGASALVLERDDSLPDSEDCYLASVLGADANHSDAIQIPAGGSAAPATAETLAAGLHYIKMAGQETFKLAVNSMVAASRGALEQAGVSHEEVAWVVAHQANKRIIDAVATRLKVPSERVYINVDRYGNTSAASIGICLDEMARSGKLKKGDLVLLTAFGSGLAWGAMLLRW